MGVRQLTADVRDPADDLTPPVDPDDVETPYETVQVDLDEGAMGDEVLSALGHHDRHLYQRGGRLVAVTTLGDQRIVPLTRFALRERITRVARFVVEDENGDEKEVQAPWALERELLERPEYPRCIRRLEGLSDTPILRADGSMWDAPGYDRNTRLLYTGGECGSVPPAPSLDDAREAVATLAEVIGDFPFEGEEHRAGWYALLLTLVGRHLIDGCVPMVVVDGNVRGCGKGLLVDTASLIACGHPLPRLAEPSDGAEVRKLLTSIAIQGDAAALLDNVERPVDSPVLAAAITSTTWSDRLLGANRVLRLPWRTTLIVTGNNVALSSDLLRRVIHIRLASPEEQPEERIDFAHAHLLEWVGSQRPRLVAAALTVLSAYLRAGMPDQRIPQWGSFENWSRVVRGALVWAGLADPVEARRELQRRCDTEVAALGRLLVAMHGRDPQGAGLSAGEILAMVDRDAFDVRTLDDELRADGLEDALATICPSRPGQRITTRQLGHRLRRYRGRVVSGLALDAEENRHSKTLRWVARPVLRGSAGNCGVSPNPPMRARAHTRVEQQDETPQSPHNPAKRKTRKPNGKTHNREWPP